MKIRMFSKLLVVLSFFVPSVTYSAIAFENYQSLVVPQPRWFPNHGFFTSYFFGLNNVSEFSLEPDSTLPTEVGVTLDTGYYGGLSIGYRNKNFRIEEEISVRYNEAQEYQNLPLLCGMIATDGPVVVASLMTNLYWDILFGNYIMPFIGAGVGGAFLVNSASDPVSGADFSKNDIGYAFQVMAGIAVMLSFHSEIDIFYRYYSATFIDYTNTISNCNAIPIGGVEVDFSPKYTANTIAIEWRISP